MPLSKARDRERKRLDRVRKRVAGTALLSKAEVRRLHRLGVSPARYLTGRRVTLDEYRDLQRQLDAKVQRIQWQSSGIRTLHEEIATLKATIETIKAIDPNAEVLQRVVQLEAERALQEAQRAIEPN